MLSSKHSKTNAFLGPWQIRSIAKKRKITTDINGFWRLWWNCAVLSAAVDSNIIHINLSIRLSFAKGRHDVWITQHLHHHHQNDVQKDKQTWHDWERSLEGNMIQILTWALCWLAERGLDDPRYKRGRGVKDAKRSRGRGDGGIDRRRATKRETD